MSKCESLNQLRTMLQDLFDARHGGADGNTVARAQGLADGYMRALSDLGLTDGRELLSVVNEERRLAARRADADLGSLLRQPVASPV